ncbi:MAG TPA: hypothetical protein VHE78_15825 [Gemmatimonadaceae bacterium]|nr:hypothetical protein [Gemmatimonadaceae bacterium]
MLHHLLHEVVVDLDLIARPISTDALRDQQVQSMDPERSWLYDVLSDGAVPGGDASEGVATADVVYADYELFLTRRGHARRASRVACGKLLKSCGIEQVRRRAGGMREYVYRFPSLAECRASFERMFAAPLTWEETPTWQTSGFDIVVATAAP